MPSDASTVIAAVRDRAVGKIAADARSVDHERRFPAAGLRGLAEAGALGLLEALRGKRVGFGDSDSPQAWILPAFALRREGLDLGYGLQAERLDRDLGKHGDTGGAELAQVERLRKGVRWRGS